MYRDPQARHNNEVAPLVPGSSSARFVWPAPGDSDVERIRSDVQEGGPGLYVFYMPDGTRKALVEAYYPEGIRDAFFEQELDPYRRADCRLGRLVAVNVIRILDSPVDQRTIQEIRRNNRAARRELKRMSTSGDRLREINDGQAADTDRAIQTYQDAYVDASLNTTRLTKIRNTSTRRLSA